MSYEIVESGSYTIRKVVEAKSKKEAKQIVENWKYGDQFPDEFKFKECFGTIKKLGKEGYR